MIPLISVLCAGVILANEPATGARSAQVSAATRAEYEAGKAAVGKGASAQLGLALWCEAHGLTAERAEHLAQALASESDNPLARGLGGFVFYAGGWLAAEQVGPEVLADAKRAAARAEYDARRDRVAELDEQENQRFELREKRAYSNSHFKFLPGEDALLAVKIVRARRVDFVRADHLRRLANARLELGEWCRSAGLEQEALVEFAAAVSFDSSLAVAWKRMGYVPHQGRWMAPEALAAEKAEAAAQHAADRHWEPLFRKVKQWLSEKKHLEAVEAELAQVSDPRAAAAVMRVFGPAPALHIWAVRALEGIAGPKASEALAMLAIFSRNDRARGNAVVALRGRPEREYAQMMVEMMDAQKTYHVEPVAGPGSAGKLIVDTQRFRLTRTYQAPPVARLASRNPYVGYDINGLPVIIGDADRAGISEFAIGKDVALRALEGRTAELIGAANLKAMAAQQWLSNDVRDVEQSNADARLTNSGVVAALRTALDAPDLNENDPEAWRKWYYDRIGYSYTSPPKVELTDIRYNLPAPTIVSCFAAGTQVQTLEGHRPIESIRAGDQVLSQSIATGALAYQIVRRVHHNPPAPTVKLTLEGGEVLLPSIYHRFWLAGKGWAMARELKAGDVLRARTGRVTVAAAEPGEVVPVYNLTVAYDKTYFVGQRAYLVHDNSLPDPGVIKPFDTIPALAPPAE